MADSPGLTRVTKFTQVSFFSVNIFILCGSKIKTKWSIVRYFNLVSNNFGPLVEKSSSYIDWRYILIKEAWMVGLNVNLYLFADLCRYRARNCLFAWECSCYHLRKCNSDRSYFADIPTGSLEEIYIYMLKRFVDYRLNLFWFLLFYARPVSKNVYTKQTKLTG